MKIRDYNNNKDFEKVYQIWQEVGWIKKDERQKKALKYFTKGGKGTVALLNDSVEGYVNSTPGKYQYLDQELSLQAVTSVTISRVARKQRLATKSTAEVIAKAASKGVHVSALGMFEQGFYNKLGYGTGSYEHLISFDPDHLNIETRTKIPERITIDDYTDIHQARITRIKRHGYCTLLPEDITHADILFGERNPFGLGFKDKEGNITHHIIFKPENDLHGPYYISWMTFNNREQFLDLMNIIRNLGDQVHLVKLWEPAGIQLQSLIKKPYKDSQVTKNSKYEVNNRATAFWQLRILNLKGCINKTNLTNKPTEFNLKLYDPIEKYLDDSSLWKGLTGNYNLKLGENSRIDRGLKDKLPTLKTDINTFSRMWIGAIKPSLLPFTNHFKAPESLIKKLDDVFSEVPTPKIDWDF
jgi:predicted acetyltransferase